MRSRQAVAVGTVLSAALAVGGLGSVTATATATPTPSAAVVVAWDQTATQAASAAAMSAPDGHVLFGYVGIAMYDAAMAVNPTHKAFLVDLDAPDASAEAAVATAAHDVLVHFLPNQAATIIDPALQTTLAQIPAGAAKDAGVALGAQVAHDVLAARAGDGYLAPTAPPTITGNPGTWVPTAPVPPIGLSLADMRPFSLKSGDQFRPAGPPALGSDRWASDYAETAAYGSAGSSVRSADQTLVARFWGEPPVPQAHASFRLFVQQHQLDLFDATRFLAMTEVSVADAMVACFDAKYHFLFWRPITAIRGGANDGNPATTGDPAWTPLLGTPNHPEYPSAHSCITPAAGLAVARFLGTDEINFTMVSVTGLGNRTFATTRDLTADVANGRVWAGIHFRSAVEDGTTIAKRSANWVLAHNFQPLD